MGPQHVYFYACAALAVGGSLSVVIAKNPIRSAMGLLLLILSVAGLFLELRAEFLAAVQLIIYAGAIVVLFLFVIMLLGPAASTPRDRRGLTVRSLGTAVLALASAGALGVLARAWESAHRRMPLPVADNGFGGIDAFGTVLFSDALIPFELSSALLMVAVVGALAVGRGRQGLHSLSRAEEEIASGGASSALPATESGGVYSHEASGHAMRSESA